MLLELDMNNLNPQQATSLIGWNMPNNLDLNQTVNYIMNSYHGRLLFRSLHRNSQCKQFLYQWWWLFSPI